MAKHNYDIPKSKKIGDKKSVIVPSYGQWSGSLKKSDQQKGGK